MATFFFPRVIGHFARTVFRRRSITTTWLVARVIHVDVRPVVVEGHGLQRVALNLHVRQLRSGVCIDGAYDRVALPGVSTSVVDIEVVPGNVEADGVCVLEQRDAGKLAIIVAVINFDRSVASVGYVDPVDVCPIENGVRPKDSVDLVD